MGIREWVTIVILLGIILIGGYMVSWWLSIGIVTGMVGTVYVYQRRWLFIDAIESEIGWWTGRREREEEYGE